jgi:Na+-translocating ferredoxin:NAD+ oxidoreductase RnfC subunit
MGLISGEVKVLDLLQRIFEAGIVGAGGAGFPTHIKLNCKTEYFIINAAECEPLLHTDKYLMEHYPKEIVRATEEVSKFLNVKETHLAIKRVNEKQIEILEKTIKEMGSSIKIFHLDN